jgi:hypothetical protein
MQIDAISLHVINALVVDELLKNLDTKTPVKMQDMIAKGISNPTKLRR